MLGMPWGNLGAPIGSKLGTSKSGGGSVTPFPLTLPGLVIWYDFSDLSTLYKDSALTTPVTADGDLIGGIVNKGSGGNATQPNDINKPTYRANIKNSLSVSSWDGNDRALGFPQVNIGQSHSIFTVIYKAGYAGYLICVSSAEGLYYVADFLTQYKDNNINSQPALVDSINTWYLHEWHRNSTVSLDMYANGISKATPANTGDGIILSLLGARGITGANDWQGYIADIYVYDNLISEENRLLLQAYINTKWAIF